MSNIDTDRTGDGGALLPCPFCGTTEGLYPGYRGMGAGKPYQIDCCGCGIDFTPREGMDVIAAWNRRAALSPTPRMSGDTIGLDEAALNAAAGKWFGAQYDNFSGEHLRKVRNRMRGAISAYLAALSVAPAPVGVQIRPLVWKFFNVKNDHGQGCWDANHPYGTFTILDCGDKFGEDQRFYAPHLSKAFSALESAQDAVFERHSQSIRSALTAGEPALPGGEDVAALREALKPFATFSTHKTSYVELPVRWCIAAAEALEKLASKA